MLTNLLLFLMLQSVTLTMADSQVCLDTFDNDGVDAVITKNYQEETLMCLRTIERPELLYFRIYRAFTGPGAYQYWQRVNYDQCVSDGGYMNCGVRFNPTETRHYYWTAIYVDSSSGSPVAKETPGTSHAIVYVRAPP